MLLKSGKDLAARLAGIIQEKYQVHRYSVDLTVKSISEVDAVGRVDFGGGDYIPAGRISIMPMRERSEDRYQWWNLTRGCYFVEFNETLALADNEIAILEPEERLWRAGGTHVAAFLRAKVAPIETLLLVNVLRLQIKENARISQMRLFRMEEGASPKAASVAQGKRGAPPSRSPR